MQDNKLILWQKGLNTNPDFAFVKKLLLQLPTAEIYLVGGAVRDLLLDKKGTNPIYPGGVKDFDFVIKNIPAKELEKVLAKLGKVNLVGKHFGVFKFRPQGLAKDLEDLDIALPRTERSFGTGGYHDFDITSDPNLPIEQDLARRDFTINALAWPITKTEITLNNLIDPFGGLADLQTKTIRTVGQPAERFAEDYTRLMRGVRLAVQLDFTIEPETAMVIKKLAKKINEVSVERVREELDKILLTANAEAGIRLLKDLDILSAILPELAKPWEVDQNRSHIFTIGEHSVRALGFAVQDQATLALRWAALLHDIGKPITKQGTGLTATFYDHDLVGAKVTKNILTRLKYSDDFIKQVSHLVRYHMFYYSLGEITDAGLRRFIVRVGAEYIADLIKLRTYDRLGMGRPKAKPYKLLEMEQRLQEVVLEPLGPKMLKIKGDDLMKALKIAPSPRVGLLLGALLAEVLQEPTKNERDYLLKKLTALNKLTDDKLKPLQPDLDDWESKRKKFHKYNLKKDD
ncbi:MAG: CCA tRNA nucleotidyltransferase [Candidatus Buchananbacteria bacterium]